MPKIKNVFVYKEEYTPDDYSAMRGPCPEGFHVPSRTEINNLRWMMVQLGLGTIAAYWSKLFIPPCSHMSITYQGTNNWISHSTGWISLWTCNASGERAENLFCYSTDTWPNMIRIQKVVASHIRPFKDGYVQPTASWTVMEGTLWSAWVFWNQTDWIISITTDWTTGYTIADKHLWATTVYSSWATLSGANCWKLFQWGNNYWFSYDHNNVVDSTTQVNVDNYWPWNYYSSSTFTAPIYWWNRFYDWALNANDNLRWWVTWMIPWWLALVEKEVYPGGEYKINEHTIAYYPLTAEANLMDKTWTYNLTNNWWVTFGEYEWVDCASFGASWSYLYNTSMATSWSSITRTFCFWCRCPQSTSSYYEIFFSLWQSRGNVLSWWYNCNRENSYWESISIGELTGWQERIWDGSISQFYWKRNHICMVWNWSSATMIVNWEIKWSYTPSLSSPSRFYLWVNSASTSDRFNWFMSRFIIEDRARVVEDAISDYNKTKRRYWY